MSADVWIEIHPCGHCGRSDEMGEKLNVTYNLSAMLTAAGFMGWPKIVGRPAAFVGNHIIEVLDFMAENPDKWRAMNPENGWGSYDVCLQGRMRRWAQACLDAPTGATIGGWL